MNDDTAEAEDRAFYPLLSALNWPSNLLPVWQALQALGVPEQNVRLVPEVGHYAAPEVMAEAADEDPDWDTGRGPQRHPLGPRLDADRGRFTAEPVDAASLRPRLKVSVRADTDTRLLPNGEVWEREVGRLAHFLPPLLAGLPGTVGTGEWREDETPVTRLVRQIAEAYPELMATLPTDLRMALQSLAVLAERAWSAEEAETRLRWLRQAADALARRPDRVACREAFERMADRLFPPEDEAAGRAEWRRAVAGLRAWVGPLFEGDAAAAPAQAEASRASLTPEAASLQPAALRSLAAALSWETYRERERLVRELVEILTTEAFSAVAALDHLWGFGWIHGRLADFDTGPGEGPPDPLREDGLLLSVMGGLDRRTLLLSLLRGWAAGGGCLGVSARPSPGGGRETAWDGALDLGCLDAGQRDELWALASWRRVVGDPLLPLETALRRLVHAEARVQWDPDAAVMGGFGTLLAQPGRTAVLGGPTRLRMPGVVILMPLSEDADAEAGSAKARLAVVQRVFLPVTLRVEVVWRETVARLGEATYLRHPFQTGARLAGLAETASDEADSPLAH